MKILSGEIILRYNWVIICFLKKCRIASVVLNVVTDERYNKITMNVQTQFTTDCRYDGSELEEH